MEIDPITGLPKELGVFDGLAKESQDITVSTVKKKFGKVNTVIEGLEGKGIDPKEIAKKLKGKFACGGTYKDKYIELQGDYRKDMREVLIQLGFPTENIKIK